MAYIRRARNPSLYAPDRQPERRATVDWTHPLSQGLTALIVPSQGFFNLTEYTGDLTLGSAATIIDIAGGQAANSTAANMTYSTPATTDIRPTTQVTLFWYGRKTATSTSGVNLIGFNHNSTDTSPWLAAALVAQNGNLILQYNVNGTFNQYAFNGALITTSLLTNYTGTIDLSIGKVELYRNGINILTNAAVTTGAFAYAATARLDFCCYSSAAARFLNGAGLIGAVYNRILSSEEIAWLNAEPYAMLIPEG